uniref:hypothetical protein n=1 Tax=Kineococcus sp. SYSU DK007 TaxID=3383128 RepID=UPI003D7E011C
MDVDSGVIIGMDPHKRSSTIEVLDRRERILGGARFTTDTAGYREMLAVGRAWPRRVWAVEGAGGIGKLPRTREVPPLAQRLVADGEQVLDVPAKLSARAREGVPPTRSVGESPPGRAARPTSPMRTPSPWSPCELPSCVGSRSTRRTSRCVCWSIAAMSWEWLAAS